VVLAGAVSPAEVEENVRAVTAPLPPELWEEWEQPKPTEHKQILVIADANPLASGVMDKVQQLEDYLNRDDRAGLLEYLNSLVPTFVANRRPNALPAGEESPKTLAAAPAES
jgi:hypothetical protein